MVRGAEPTRPATLPRATDLGAGVVLMLALIAVAVLLAAAGAVVAAIALSQSETSQAADFSALAGAEVAVEGQARACSAAATVAARSEVTLQSCVVAGLDVQVVVVRPVLGPGPGQVAATARAGPP